MKTHKLNKDIKMLGERAVLLEIPNDKKFCYKLLKKMPPWATQELEGYKYIWLLTKSVPNINLIKWS